MPLSTIDTSSISGLGYGFKNRIINGDMRIDQRNAGVSVTPTSSGYTLDRWQAVLSQASKYSVQQNAGAVTPPAGFKNYLGVTSLSAYSVGAGDFFVLSHYIEGLNAADLGFGLSTASTVTLSFWVRSSLTGSFGGSLQNSAQNRCYPFTYTINSANTWEQKFVTIAGDTSGTWLTDTGRGVGILFGLGVGSTYGSGTAGAWVGSQVFVPSGSTSVVGTSGATFYITGVQLEKGTVATEFDYRPYGAELQLCKRYLPIYNSTTANSDPVGTHSIFSTTGGVAQFIFDVEPRVPPSGLAVTGTFRATIPGNNTWTVTPTLASSSLKAATLNLAGSAMQTGFGTLLSSSLPAQLQFTGCEL